MKSQSVTKDFVDFTKRNPCKVLGAVLNAGVTLNPSQLTATSGVRNRHPYFLNEETEAQRG